MYYPIMIDENGETVNPDLSSVEGWAMDSDLANQMVSDGYIQEDDGTFSGPNGERVKIIEK